MFQYSEFTTRNIGFVTPKEQEKIKSARIFIPGVGGMGGAALACLARSGVENFIIADLDYFEVSNLNRQMFANLDSVGSSKVETSVAGLKKINPQIQVETYGIEWVEHLDEILPSVDLVINGCDDARSTVKLMRAAKKHGKTVVDAFASTLPNIYLVKAEDPRPEETFSYPSLNQDPDSLSQDQWALCTQREIEYVLTHSSTAKHVVLDIAAEMVSGKRSRISFAPMVWTTGCFMAYEAIKVILGVPSAADYRGVFFNPWSYKVERPYGFVLGGIRKFLVRRFLQSLLNQKAVEA